MDSARRSLSPATWSELYTQRYTKSQPAMEATCHPVAQHPDPADPTSSAAVTRHSPAKRLTATTPASADTHPPPADPTSPDGRLHDARHTAATVLLATVVDPPPARD